MTVQTQSRDKTRTFREMDKRYTWHPFTQMKEWAREDVVVIERGEGVWLFDTDGKKYLDGVSSLWCNVHGHRVPEIDEAINRQLGAVAHSTFLGLSHRPAIELSEKLAALAPGKLSRVFYSDSGSEGVEIALKMAFQFWAQSGRPEKNRFARLKLAYHGDTVGAVSVGGIELFHDIYKPLLFKTFEAPSPYVYRWPTSSDPQTVCAEAAGEIENIFRKHRGEIAAFIIEPLMQGAAGMIAHPRGFLKRAAELTKQYGILLICDEVATGFGRTGTMFACEQEEVNPDIMVLAKGLTGGYLPLAATLATEEIFRAFWADYSECKTFFHGHTYTANPLACSAAIASLGLFEKNQVLKNLRLKIERLRRGLEKFYELPIVGDVRQAGTMVGIELVKDRGHKTPFAWEEKIGVRVIERARKKGAILRPLGPVIVLMPPLVMENTELDDLLSITYDSIRETGAGH
ncbi:MAG: adenosylmethionine--8-amino-7-oxononanoate transaminase [Omnitrophica bacterium GWA2_52_8]|nr:MAG: adenosylmethionine--8-amino-7-oxononanoate transaminase [Omnitrophica bacterium GWA2_52_8]